MKKIETALDTSIRNWLAANLVKTETHQLYWLEVSLRSFSMPNTRAFPMFALHRG